MLFTVDEYLDIALQFYYKQEFEYALEFVNKAIELEGNKAEAWLLKGNIAGEDRDYTNAIASYTTCIQIDDNNGDAHHYLGQIAMYRKDDEKALMHFEKAITSITGYREDYYKSIARLYYAMKDYSNCNKICNAIRTEHYDDFDAYALMVNALIKMEEYKQASDICEQYTHVQRENADVWNNFGYCLILLEDYSRAKLVLERALNYNPEHAYANNNYGFVLLKTGCLNHTIDYINLSIERDRSNSYAYKNRALYTLHTGGNKYNAKLDLLRAQELKYAELHGSRVDDLLAYEFGIN